MIFVIFLVRLGYSADLLQNIFGLISREYTLSDYFNFTDKTVETIIILAINAINSDSWKKQIRHFLILQVC